MFLPALKRAALTGLWFTLLTLPVLAVRVNTLDNVVEWRWSAPLKVGAAAFVLALAWQLLRHRKGAPTAAGNGALSAPWLQRLAVWRRPALGALLAAALLFPLAVSPYQVNIAASALIYVVLGLGLNLTVGLLGLLDLGYVAFFALGAYAYGLLHHYFSIGFWPALPAGALAGAAAGALLGFPILRLRGDYLAIVTLGFASIVRIVLENWDEVTLGAAGIANIPRPGLFGLQLAFQEVTTYIYYLALALAVLTAFITARLKHSRIGRAWIALREDEVAAAAMGIDRGRTRLAAYVLSGGLAGAAGVLFAAKTTYINPASFTFMESAVVLCIVVLGGMGSIAGVVLGAGVLVLLPEYLRAFAEYRMLVFGAVLVAVMLFRPQGLVGNRRRRYELERGGEGGEG